MGRRGPHGAQGVVPDAPAAADTGVVAGVFDCVRCGACCCNTDENRAEAYPWYVEIDDRRSALLRVPALRGAFVTVDPGGRPHLRLDADGRCSALLGALGCEVRCAVYEHRPTGCRRVSPGDADCCRARVERGLVAPGAEAPPPRARRGRLSRTSRCI